MNCGSKLAPPNAAEVHSVLSAHLRALHRFYGEHQGLRVARKHIAWYLKGRPGGTELKKQLMLVESASDQLRLIDHYFGSPQCLAA
jgi:tRNA-dihydrouridine synthase B